MPPAMLGGRIHLGGALQDFDRVERVHRPADHRRTRVPPAIGAMTQRVGKSLAFGLVANRTAMAATGHWHASSPPVPACSSYSMDLLSAQGPVNNSPDVADRGYPVDSVLQLLGIESLTV